MRYLLAIFFIVTLVACNPKKQMKASGYFEGLVEYNTVYSGADTMMVGAFKKAFGVRSISYISEKGFVKREYIDTNNIIIFTEIFRPDSLKVFFLRSNNDTVLCRDITSKTDTKILEKLKNSTEKVLGHTVDMVETLDKLKYKSTNQPFWVYSTYYNDTNYKLSPFVYRNAASAAVEDVFTFSPHVTTKYIFTYNPDATITSTATRIIPSVVPEWHFEIPKNKKIVQQN